MRRFEIFSISKIARSSFGLVLVLLALLAYPRTAQGTLSLSATVDKTHLSLADTLELSVRINGTQQAPAPTLPPLSGFKVENRGTTTSLQVINGARHESVTYRYLLSPLREGTFEIGPVRLHMDGNRYESPPIQVNVTASANLPDGEALVFAEAEISNDRPYVQQQTVVTYRLYRKVEAANLKLEATTDHFRKVSLGEPREYSRIINGVRYYVHEKSFALFPMREGRLILPPALIQLDLVHRNSGRPSPFGNLPSLHNLDPFFNDPLFGGQAEMERKILRTQPLEVNVKPLPEEGRPASFSNLVGQLELASNLSKSDLESGDTATWTVTVSGLGNLAEARLNLTDMPSGLKIYPDQPQIEETPEMQVLTGKKRFTFALVPTQPGGFTLPVLTLPYFDTESETYRTLHTPAHTLSVRPGPSQEGVSKNPKNETAVLYRGTTPPDSGLLPLHTDRALFESQGTISDWLWPWASGFLLPPLFYLAGRMTYMHRQRLKFDVAYVRQRQALKRAEWRLEQLQSRNDMTGREAAREVSLILRDYIGDQMNLQGTAFTPGEVAHKMREHQMEDSLIRDTRAFLDRCEEMEYAAVVHGGQENLVDESRRLLSALENQS